MLKQHKHTFKVVIIVFLLLFSQLIVLNSSAADDPDILWTKMYHNGLTNHAYAVTTDSNDNVIVTGNSKIGITQKCYTIKYSPEGTQILDIVSNTIYDSKAYDITVDSHDNIILAGSCIGIFGHFDYYIVKYDENGNELWHNTFDSGYDDFAYGIAVDLYDNIVITGQASDSYHTIKYDSNGIEQWNATYNNSYITCANSVVCDSYGNIIVTGNAFTATCCDWYTIKYDENGNELWHKIFGNGEYNSANSVDVDSNNDIVVAGNVLYGANTNMDIIKYDENGNELWHKSHTTSVVESAEDVIVNSMDYILVAGSSYVTFDKYNYALLKFDSDGTFLWSTFFDSDHEDDTGFGVAVDTINKIIITGFTRNILAGYDWLTIKYGEKPVASFTYEPLNPTDLDDIQFTDTSIDPAGIIIDWLWDFGDGESSTEQHPTHQYNDDGIFTVTLTVTDDDGETHSYTDTVNVANAPPNADFTYTPSIPTPLEPIQFTDASVDLDGTIVDWQWDFGDENTSTDQNPTHSYPNGGSYIVNLTVIDDEGLTDKISKTIFVNTIPVASFSYDPPQPNTNEQIIFTDQSTDAYGSIVIWFWDFGNGDTSNEQNPTYQYSDDGSYLVTLNVTDDNGFSDDYSELIQINNVKPNADFNYIPLDPTDLQIISFSDISTDSDGIITSWNWSFGAGNFANTQNPTHQYADNGSYTITLIVTDDDGATDEISKQIIVTNVPPIANFSYDPLNPMFNDLVNFYDSSVDLDGTITNWLWDFGDSDTSNQQNPSHSYDEGGSYAITLTVTDNDGANANIVKNIQINNDTIPPEIKDSTADTAYTNDVFIFSSTVTDNKDVEQVQIKYWYQGQDFILTNMTKIVDDYYEHPILIQQTLNVLYYQIIAKDSSNNINNTEEKEITIIDNDNPEITNIFVTPNPQLFDKSVNISCDVFDNIQVDNVKIIIDGPDGFTPIDTIMQIGSYYYNSSYNILGTYSFYIWTNDTSGNIKTNQSYSFEIINNLPYQATNPIPSNNSIDISTSTTLSVNVSDPDNNTLNVYFYNAADDSLIASANDTVSGNIASITWPGLNTETQYYWYVIVNDSKAEVISKKWNFKTMPPTVIEEPPDNGDGNPNPFSPTNKNPIAIITTDETIEFVDTMIKFDGSKSYDPNNDPITYNWDFDDKTTSEEAILNHSYSKVGVYTISLAVSDGRGGIGRDYHTIEIITANYAPDKPIVAGNETGSINVSYSYTAISTDKDDDNISYTFYWGDGKENTTDFLANATIATQNHSWTSAGIYTISVNATDGQSRSDTAEYTVLINTVEIWYNDSKIGYLTDDDNDSIFNYFYYYETNNKTEVKHIQPSKYLIDLNNDSIWDLIYDHEKNETIDYFSDPDDSQGGNALLALLPFILLILIFIIILLLLPFRKKPKPDEKGKGEKEVIIDDKSEQKDQTRPLIPSPTYEPRSDIELDDELILDDVHKFVDSLDGEDIDTPVTAEELFDETTYDAGMSQTKKSKTLKS